MHLKLLKRPVRIFSFALAAALFALLSGCSKPAQSPKPAPVGVQKQAIATAPTKTAEAVQEAAAPVYAYTAVGRRDPFAPIIQREVKKLSADRPPLERYNISDFKLSGIVWGGFGYNAILEGPDGKGYFVKVGTVLGPNHGVIKKITQKTMVVEEKFKAYTGEMQRKEVVVELRKSEEALP